LHDANALLAAGWRKRRSYPPGEEKFNGRLALNPVRANHLMREYSL
jgi:hypothetical protein